jgi:hypothetical protein
VKCRARMCADARERATRSTRAGLHSGVGLARPWRRGRPGSLASVSGNWTRSTARGQWRGDGSGDGRWRAGSAGVALVGMVTSRGGVRCWLGSLKVGRVLG